MLVTLVVLSLLAAFVHGLPFHSSMHSLVSRQDAISPSDIPAPCRTQCTPFINTLNECISSPVVACGCTTSTKRTLDTCYDCLIDLVPSLKPEWDSNEQTFYDGCAAAGKPIPGASTDDLSSTRTTTRPPRSSSTGSSTRSTSTATATSPLTLTTTVANENNPPSTTAPLGWTTTVAPLGPTSSDNNGAITASLHTWLIIMGALALGVFGI